MQRVVNYGSFLQAWALREILLECGASSVGFIDIEPGRQLKGYQSGGCAFEVKRYSALAKTILSGQLGPKIRDRDFYRELKLRFLRDYFPMLGVDDHAGPYDVAVIGSDEVFNCCQSTPWGFTEQLYGAIPGVPKVISYAASFGNTTLSALRKHGLEGTIARRLDSLAAISVRDENSLYIVKELTGRHAVQHFDPVLVYDFSPRVEKIPPKPGRYMVVYSYTGRISDPQEIQAILDYARTHSLETVSIMCRYDWCDRAVFPEDPFDVLAWFRDAQCVVTDTFHGTIFSVKGRTPFVTLIRKSNRNKLLGLLWHLGMHSRYVTTAAEIGSILETPVHWDGLDEILSFQAERTRDYLKKFMF